mmetsp:Transcript_28311/g.56773  ORF Transcript_28311/g.56773 Transcript_28311/m.56773 type:complete len:252 (-) Transcript_28311:401-1156(-)
MIVVVAVSVLIAVVDCRSCFAIIIIFDVIAKTRFVSHYLTNLYLRNKIIHPIIILRSLPNHWIRHIHNTSYPNGPTRHLDPLSRRSAIGFIGVNELHDGSNGCDSIGVPGSEGDAEEVVVPFPIDDVPSHLDIPRFRINESMILSRKWHVNFPQRIQWHRFPFQPTFVVVSLVLLEFRRRKPLYLVAFRATIAVRVTASATRDVIASVATGKRRMIGFFPGRTFPGQPFQCRIQFRKRGGMTSRHSSGSRR